MARSLGKRLTLFTHNLGLLSLRALGQTLHEPAPHVERRLPAVAAHLREVAADVIAVQEVWSRRHRRFLAEALRPAFPHVVRDDARRWFGFGGGLMLFSRHPIVRSRFAPFRAQSGLERVFVSKGCLIARVLIAGLGTVVVANAHTTAGGFRHAESPGTERLRRAQLAQVTEMVAEEQGVDLNVILGDLNAGPEASPDDYRSVCERGFRDAFRLRRQGGGREHTWDAENALIAGGQHRSGPDMRIDHVLLGGPRSADVVVEQAEVTAHEPRVEVGENLRVPLSDHYALRVDLTL